MARRKTSRRHSNKGKIIAVGAGLLVLGGLLFLRNTSSPAARSNTGALTTAARTANAPISLTQSVGSSATIGGPSIAVGGSAGQLPIG